MEKINVTVFTKTDADDLMTKAISDNGHGELAKDASRCKMARGSAESRTINLKTLPEMLSGIQQNQALGLCNVTREATSVVARGMQSDGAVERSMQQFPWCKGPAFLLLDIDPRAEQKFETAGELIEQLENAWPGIGTASRVEAHGTSSWIADADGIMRSAGGSYHIYVAVEDMSDVLESLPGDDLSKKLRALRERILMRCWNAGQGFIFITRDGRQLPRTLIDLTVFSPERLIFEAAPLLPDGWSQQRPAPVYIDGGWLPTDIMTIPPTREERAGYEQSLLNAKSETRDEANRMSAQYRRAEIKMLEDRGYARTDARRIVQNRQADIIDAEDELYFQGDSEPIRALEVVLAPHNFVGRYLADPVEPDYGGLPGTFVRTKAVIQVNEITSEVGIYSFAHGGRRYLIKLDRLRYIAALEHARKAGLDLLTLWKPLLVRHTQDMPPDEANAVLGQVAKMLRIDKGPAKAALELEKSAFASDQRKWRHLVSDGVEFESLDETEDERTERLAHEHREQRTVLWEQCKVIAMAPDILQLLVETQEKRGVVGEHLAQQAVYLAVTSRFFNRPVNLLVKGDSSGGKSFNTEQTLKFFPDDAVVNAAGMSEKAIFYMPSMKNRVLYMAEATPLQRDDNSTLAYAVRTLLSEGKLSYWRAPSLEDPEPVAQLIEVDGPTGFLCTTTAVTLHSENETRMLSVSIDESESQTRRVLEAIANRAGREEIDFEPWHAFQRWIELSEKRVSIPYSDILASLVSAAQTRMRRDFTQLLTLIETSAILHQATRKRDKSGVILATVADYASARQVIIQGIQSTSQPKEGVRQVVDLIRSESIRKLRKDAQIFSSEESVPDADDEIPYDRIAAVKVEMSSASLAIMLKKGRTTAFRWVREALEGGYLVNHQKSRGRYCPMELSVNLLQADDSDGQEPLPTAEALKELIELLGLAATSPGFE